MPVINIVTIGDGSVGKTCLIQRFIHNTFNIETQSSVFDIYEKDLVFGEETFTLKIKDCGGQVDAKDTRA